jgi:GMP reductase
MHIEHDLKLDYSDVLIKPKRSILSTRAKVSLDRPFRFRYSSLTWTGIPIMAANMSTVGTIDMLSALHQEKMLTCLHKHYAFKELSEITHLIPSYGESLVLTIGIGDKDLESLEQFLKILPETKFICIDVANGYMQRLVDCVEKVRADHPQKIIIAGNVVSPEMTEALIIAGADIVKVGIGSGAACTTRMMTGIGMPQLSAVIECSDAAHGLGGHIIADGGCTVPGDIVKAFGGGADFVMLGSMLAGHDESGGEIIEVDGKKLVSFYGMSSHKANEEFSGGLKEYRAPEGREVLIPYKGSVRHTIQRITGGLRSACTYIGASYIKELPKRTTFVRVNRQLNESLRDHTIAV